VPPGVLVDETFSKEPISGYGQNKLACEKLLMEAHAQRNSPRRSSCPVARTGRHSLIDNLEGDAVTWDRVANDLPVLCSADGLGLWVATHRDDVGKAFAYAAMNPRRSASYITRRAIRISPGATSIVKRHRR